MTHQHFGFGPCSGPGEPRPFLGPHAPDPCPLCGGRLFRVTPATAMTVPALTDAQLELLALIAPDAGWDAVCWACDRCDEVYSGGPAW